MKVYNIPINYIIEVENIIVPLQSVYIKIEIQNDQTYYYLYNAYTDNLIGRTKQNLVNLLSSFGIEKGGNNV